jgi:hypothetical protein
MVRFDHALIFVPDIRAAIRDYTSLGFRVVPGGAHEGDPTTNALVPLADGSYLELIAFRRRSTLLLLQVLARLGLVAHAARAPLARRFAERAAGGPGLLDVVLCVDAVPPVIEAARREGRVIHGPVRGRRMAPDGRPITWELGVPEDDELPLLIADITPRSLRAAASPGPGHANGVTGVTEAVLPARDPTVAGARLRDVLGLPAARDGERSVIDIGTTRLVLEPVPRMASYRPTRLALATGRSGNLDVRAAHGAVLELR